MMYQCFCIIHVYDGITTRVKKETHSIEAENEKDAKIEAENKIRKRYRILSHLSLSSVTVLI